MSIMTNFTSYDIWLTTDPDLEGPNCPTCDAVGGPDDYTCHGCGEEFDEPDYEQINQDNHHNKEYL